MTMPHLMNCSHSDNGWCLDCVKKLYDSKQVEYTPPEDYILVPKRAEIIGESSGWTEYSTEYGHCALCGYLQCNGMCMGGT